MTARRVIDQHAELQGSGDISHSLLDSYLNSGSFLVVTGSSAAPASRVIAAGVGIGLVDSGPGGALTISVSGVLSSSNHMTLHQLVHLTEEGGPYGGFSGAIRESGPNPFVTASIWWTDITKTKKIVEKLITRNSNQQPTSVVWNAYDSTGTTIIESSTDTIAYDGSYEISRTRVTSP